MGGGLERGPVYVRHKTKKTASKLVQGPQKRQGSSTRGTEKKVGSGRPKITKQKERRKERVLLLKAFRGGKGIRGEKGQKRD